MLNVDLEKYQRQIQHLVIDRKVEVFGKSDFEQVNAVSVDELQNGICFRPEN